MRRARYANQSTYVLPRINKKHHPPHRLGTCPQSARARLPISAAPRTYTTSSQFHTDVDISDIAPVPPCEATNLPSISSTPGAQPRCIYTGAPIRRGCRPGLVELDYAKDTRINAHAGQSGLSYGTRSRYDAATRFVSVHERSMRRRTRRSRTVGAAAMRVTWKENDGRHVKYVTQICNMNTSNISTTLILMIT